MDVNQLQKSVIEAVQEFKGLIIAIRKSDTKAKELLDSLLVKKDLSQFEKWVAPASTVEGSITLDKVYATGKEVLELWYDLETSLEAEPAEVFDKYLGVLQNDYPFNLSFDEMLLELID